MEQESDRRRFLSVVLTGAAIGVAGCSGDDGSGNGTDGGNGGGMDTTTTSNGGMTTTTAAETTEPTTTEEPPEETTEEPLEETPVVDPDNDAPDGVFGQFQFDAANTGFVPDASVPSSPSLDWQYPEEPADSIEGPVYVDGALYAIVRADETRTMVALDAITGEVLLEDEEVFSSVFSYFAPAYLGSSLYVNGGEAIRSLSASDFSEEWTGAQSLSSIAEMTVTDDALYGWGGGFEETSVRSLSRSDGSLRWEQTLTLDDLTRERPVAVAEDTVLVPGDELLALDANDGSELWSVTAEDTITAPPTVVDGTAYVGTEAGRVRGYDVADGTEVLTAEPDVGIFDIEEPLVHNDGRLFGTSLSASFAVDIASGSVDWTLDTGFAAPPTAADDVFLGLSPGGDPIRAVDRSDGSMAWGAGPIISAGSMSGSGRVFAIGSLVFAAYNGVIVGLS